MATFHCHAPAREIWKRLEIISSQSDGSFVRQSEDSGVINILIKGKDRQLRISVHPSMGRQENSLIHIVRVIPTRSWILSLTLFITGGLVSSLAIYRLMWATMESNFVLTPLLFGAVLLICGISLQSLLYAASRPAVSSLSNELARDFKLQQIRPLIDSAIEVKTNFWLAVGIALTIAITGLLVPSLTVKIVIFTIMVYWVLVISFSRPPIKDWRFILIGVEQSLTSYCLIMLLHTGWIVLALGYLEYVGRNDPEKIKSETIGELIDGAVAELPFLSDLEPKLPRDEFHELWKYRFTRLIEEDLESVHFYRVRAALFISGFTCFLILSIVGIRQSCRHWKHVSLYSAAATTLTPVVQANRMSLKEKACFYVLVLISVVIHWLTAALSIEIISFYIYGRCLFVRLMTLVFSFLEADLVIALGPVIGTIASGYVLSLTAFPGLLLISLAMYRIGLICIKEWAAFRSVHLSNDDEFSREKKILQEISSASGTPNANIIPCSGFRVTATPGLFGRGQIILGKDVGNLLVNDDELAAILAHELHHLIDDTRSVRRLELLSIAGLCPFNYLLILYDFARSEFLADEFASRVVGPEALKEAMVKLSTARKISRESEFDSRIDKHERKSLIPSWVLLLVTSLVRIPIMGAAYPSDWERRARLDQIDRMNQ